MTATAANRGSVEVAVERCDGSSRQAADEILAAEEPLEIQLGYGDAASRTVKSIAVTMRTPGNDTELAAGFLFTEGIIKGAEDLAGVKPVFLRCY